MYLVKMNPSPDDANPKYQADKSYRELLRAHSTPERK